MILLQTLVLDWVLYAQVLVSRFRKESESVVWTQGTCLMWCRVGVRAAM